VVVSLMDVTRSKRRCMWPSVVMARSESKEEEKEERLWHAQRVWIVTIDQHSAA
jgi:hypothetical protein